MQKLEGNLESIVEWFFFLDKKEEEMNDWISRKQGEGTNLVKIMIFSTLLLSSQVFYIYRFGDGLLILLRQSIYNTDV